MLTQYRIRLTPDRQRPPRPEWGYCFYAALLQHAAPGFGDAVHQDGVTPVSQFLRMDRDGRLVWTVNLLGTASEEALSAYLDGVTSVTLRRERMAFPVQEKDRRVIPGVEALLALTDGKPGPYLLRFLTPAAFKSQGRYRNFPDTRLILQSLIKKWNGCIPDCPIEDEDGQGMEAMAEGLSCVHFRLQDRAYSLKRNAIPGFTGELVLENHLAGFQHRLADALLLFSDFAGVGIKTALGMGGVEAVRL